MDMAYRLKIFVYIDLLPPLLVGYLNDATMDLSFLYIFKERSVVAQFRLGILPIEVEVGRYKQKSLTLNLT